MDKKNFEKCNKMVLKDFLYLLVFEGVIYGNYCMPCWLKNAPN